MSTLTRPGRSPACVSGRASTSTLEVCFFWLFWLPYQVWWPCVLDFFVFFGSFQAFFGFSLCFFGFFWLLPGVFGIFVCFFGHSQAFFCVLVCFFECFKRFWYFHMVCKVSQAIFGFSFITIKNNKKTIQQTAIENHHNRNNKKLKTLETNKRICITETNKGIHATEISMIINTTVNNKRNPTPATKKRIHTTVNNKRIHTIRTYTS